MKYILFTCAGHTFPIARRLLQEGQEVIVAQVQDYKELELPGNNPKEAAWEKKRRLSLYNGLIPKRPATQVLKEMATFPDKDQYFVFFDLQNLYKYAAQVAEMGFMGNFPTEEDYLLEMDRDRAKKLVDKHYGRLKVAATHTYKKISEAEKFLSSSEDLWVLKGNAEKAPTVVPDVADPTLAHHQLLHALQNYQDLYEAKGFILEELISDPIEITPEKIYFNGEPVATTIDIENKPLGSGNLSLQTGCAADLVFPTAMDDKINAMAFPPFVDELAKKRRGMFIWDASLLIDRRTGKIHFGEFCSNRPGYNALFTECTLAGSVHKFFEQIAKGKNPFNQNTAAASVRMFNLYQDNNGRTQAGGKITYNQKIETDLWLWDAQQNDDHIQAVGFNKNLGVFTAADHSLKAAVAKIYRSIDQFSFEGAYYRPQFDYLSLEYPTSILNRLNYGLERGFYKIPFALM